MARKLASVLIPLAILSPAVVHALGLGGIELNSFLNQPLDAQIKIISSKKGETDGMNVKLASPEAFARAGLEYTNYLRKLNFDVIRKSDGSQFIKVSTRQGFREPFLQFLLEVNWANGRILREYSELVDPPSLVQASQSSTQLAPVARPSATTTTTRSTTPKPPAYVQPPASSEARGYVGDTYTTKRNDTAYQIARDTRPDESVTVEQSMMALLRANPEAFIRQNVNRLKAGYTLNIPDRDSMLSQSHSEALAELRRQTAEWKADRRTAAGTPRGRLEILPPQAAEGGAGETGAAAAGSADARRDAMLAREAAEAQRQENAELRMRISELEEQIENTKRLAQLKSDQLAALESKLAEMNAAAGTTAEAPTAPAEPVTAEAEPTAAEEPAAEPEAPLQTAETTEAEPAETRVPAEIVEAVPAKPGTPINQHVVSDFTPVDLNALPKTTLPAEPFKTGSASEAAAAPMAAKGNLMDQAMAYIKQNPMVKWIAAGAGGLLVVILGLIMARRGRGEDQFEESILQEQAAAAPEFSEQAIEPAETAASEDALLETVDVDQVDAESPQEQTDTSFLSDMVLSDMSELQEGGEADPLTEADVFLAYGRYGPAENMIKGAIAKEPERNDLRLKLLEIYYSSKNREAFEQEAASLHADLEDKPDAETWAKVVEMGEDLCPGNKLFVAAAAGAAAAATGAALASDEEDTEIMDFDLGEFEDQIDTMDASETVQNAAGGLDDDGLDLDLDQLVAGDDTAEDLDDTLEFTTELESMQDDSADEVLEKTEELEFDLSGSGSEQREITRRIDTRESGQEEITRLMDTAETQDEITEELEGIADVLKSEEVSEPIEREITRRIDTNAAAGDNDATQILDIPNVDELEDFSADTGVPMDEGMDFDDDALADIDEIGTKLDLARAYIDMGDPEGARSILDEVIDEGNDSQKNEAQQLLSQI